MEKNKIEEDKTNKKKMKFGLKFKFLLTIITLVTLIISAVSGYFLVRESEILSDYVLSSVKREITHLSNVTRDNIGADELAILDSINSLKKIPYLKYVFVLNKQNEIVQYFDYRKQRKIGEIFNDKIKRKINDSNLIPVKYIDPVKNNYYIYDFYLPVYGKGEKNENKIIASVIIGMSNQVIRDQIEEATKTILVISAGILIISILLSVILITFAIKPIKSLSEGAAIIGSGNFDHKITISSSDELGNLANEFNIMTTMIKESKNKEIENRVMEEQLEVAREIQEGLNPMGFYNKNGIQIKGHTKAAKGVGGDYFDYLDIDEHRVGALISDVSGKGVPASLVMVMIRTVFTSYISSRDVDCASVVTAINDSLSADFAIDKFATLFFFIYDRKSEELSFSNAGHGPLFCYRSSLGACTVTKLDGVPIGIMEDIEYNQAKVKFKKGDMIVMYTDGVTEMRNDAKEEYGMNRLQKLLLDNKDLDADKFVELLVEDLEVFRQNTPPHDDTTSLVFKRVE